MSIAVLENIPYKASFTRDRFLLYEMKMTARMMCEGLTDKEIVDKVYEENIFQYPTEKSIKRMVRTCLGRLKNIDDESLVAAIANDTQDAVKQICLYEFPLGKTEEEVRNIVAFLRYVVQERKDPFIIIPYSIEISNRKYQDMLKVFNERVVYHLIEHIGNHLVEIGIDMGMTGNTSINVSGNNNMVNFATDNSTINNSNIDINELIKSIDLVRKNIKSSGLKESDQQDINESLEVIQEDITKTGTLGKASMVALKAMRGIQVAGSLAESMRSLYELVGIASKILG